MTLVSKEYYIKSIAADRFLDETYMSNNGMLFLDLYLADIFVTKISTAPHKDDYFTNSNLVSLH